MSDHSIQSLTDCRYCQIGQDDTLTKDLNTCKCIVFEQGQIIMNNSSLNNEVYCLKNGIIKLYHVDSNGQEHLLNVFSHKFYFGVSNLLTNKVNLYKIYALTKSSVCIILKDRFKEMIENNSNLLQEVLDCLVKNEWSLTNKLVSQINKQTVGRVAELVLYFSDVIFRSDEYEILLNRSEIGKMTGTTRENVSKILSKFANDDIIKVSQGIIKIIDKDRLIRISRYG